MVVGMCGWQCVCLFFKASRSTTHPSSRLLSSPPSFFSSPIIGKAQKHQDLDCVVGFSGSAGRWKGQWTSLRGNGWMREAWQLRRGLRCAASECVMGGG